MLRMLSFRDVVLSQPVRECLVARKTQHLGSPGFVAICVLQGALKIVLRNFGHQRWKIDLLPEPPRLRIANYTEVHRCLTAPLSF